MEMSENGVEHQATVDKGLKMKIKRKQPGSKSDTKGKSACGEETLAKAATTPTKNSAAELSLDHTDSKTMEDDTGSGASDNSSQRSQKRKRNTNNNNKSGKKGDVEADERGNAEANGRGKTGELGSGGSLTQNKDGGVERAANRKRPAASSQEPGESADKKDENDDYELPSNNSRVGGKNTKHGAGCVSALQGNGEKQDSGCLSELADRDCSVSLDPYEFVSTRVEEQRQTPVKKFRSDKMDFDLTLNSMVASTPGTVPSSSSSSSSSSSKAKCDVGTVTYNVGVMTDPDCLGPCEPGTSVILEGIVWSESNNGILVVNVTWRGKTYVGTLMDATKHHWASPRFREESPSTDLDYRVPKSKRGTPVTDVTEGRRLRKCRRTTAASASNNGSVNGSNKAMVTRQSPPVGFESNVRQRGRVSEHLADAAPMELASAAKRAKLDIDVNDEAFYKCMAPDCNKKFKHISGLRYHQSQAHKKQSNGVNRKSETASTSETLQEKAKGEKRKDDLSLVKQPSYESMETSCPAVNNELLESDTNISTICDAVVAEDANRDAQRTPKETVIPCLEPAKSDDSCEVILASADCNAFTNEPAAMAGDTIAVSDPENVVPLVEVSGAKAQQLSSSENILEKADDAQRPNEFEHSRLYVISPGFPAVARTAETGSGDVSVSSDAKERPKTWTSEAELEQMTEPRLLLSGTSDSSPSHSADVFHKPILRTPDLGKHKGLHLPVDKPLPTLAAENGQSVVTVFRPQNIGLKLSPPVVNSNEDKSPAYSDISDTNDGSLTENEMRLKRTDRDAKRTVLKTEKAPIRKCESYGSSGLPPPNSSFRSSPFPSPASASPLPGSSIHQSRRTSDSMLKPRDMEAEHAKKMAAASSTFKNPVIGSKPSNQGQPGDRHRTERSPASNDVAAEMLHAQENGLMWMEMFQRSANMVPYGYSIDPIAHMQLMSTNPEYRTHYERWYLGQQCYRQLLQAESERCAASDKPVDMSAKGGTSTSSASNIPDMKFKMSQKSHGSSIDERLSSEKHQSLGLSGSLNSSSEFHRSIVSGHHDRSSSASRDRPPMPRQDSVLLRTSEREEKPLDLMNSVNKTKSKPMDSGIGFSGSSSNPLGKAKVSTNVIGGIGLSSSASHQTTQSQDFPKTSMPPMRYDGSFPAISNPPYLDSLLGAGGAVRYPVLNSKYPTPAGNEKSNLGPTGPTRKTGQSSATTLSSKEMGPIEKTESHRQFTDSLELNNDGLLQEKPSALPSGHSSPLTLRHLHTHHHTHVVGAAPYSLYGSYSGLMSPVPTIVPPVVPVIPPTYIPK